MLQNVYHLYLSKVYPRNRTVVEDRDYIWLSVVLIRGGGEANTVSRRWKQGVLWGFLFHLQQISTWTQVAQAMLRHA